MAKALRFQAHAPLKFWGECVLIAAILINILSSSVLSGKSPYEVFYRHPPTLDIIRVFGCLCYATTLNNTNKFSQRAIPAIFMGYSVSHKGYMLYNISTGTFFISRDVSFREKIFPFKYPKSTFLHTLSSGPTPIFSISVLASNYDDSFPATMDVSSPLVPASDPPSPSLTIPCLHLCYFSLLYFLLQLLLQSSHPPLPLKFLLMLQHHLLSCPLLLQLYQHHHSTNIFLLFLHPPWENLEHHPNLPYGLQTLFVIKSNLHPPNLTISRIPLTTLPYLLLIKLVCHPTHPS